MKKAIVTPAIFALIVLLAGVFFLHDEFELLQNSTVETATVSSCDSKRFRRSGKRSNGYVTQYALFAISDYGISAKGPYIHPTRELCQKRLHRDLKILVSDLTTQGNRIYSFFDFWLAPFLFGLAFVMCLVSASVYLTGRKQLSHANTALAITAPLLLAASYWLDYESSAASIVPGTGGSASNSASSSASNSVLRDAQLSSPSLDRCIRKTLYEGGYKHERDIQKLICQEMNITNLARLEGLNSLERLYVQDNKIADLRSLPRLENLRVLSIANNDTTSLAGIANAPALQELQSNSNKLTRIDELATLEALETVAFMFSDITDLSPLEPLNNLKSVNFNYNNISDITPLSNKPTLAKVHLFNNAITDITPLYNNTGLELLAIVGKKNTIKCEQVDYLLSRMSFNIHDQWRELCH